MADKENGGYLTTHVLDTSKGVPASGLDLQLWRMTQVPELVMEAVTNSDGRVDSPLLEGDSFTVGTYELRYQAGNYFRQKGVDLPEIPYLDEVILRFGVSAPTEHYHVPLLLSPFGYTTYRGS